MDINQDAPLPVDGFRVELAVLQRALGGGHGEVRVSVLALGHVVVPIFGNVEVFYL